MNDERDVNTRLSRLERGFGMVPEKRNAQMTELEKLNDWELTCKGCGKKYTGTIAELKGLVCSCGGNRG